MAFSNSTKNCYFLPYLIIAKKRTQIILTVLISDIVSLFFLQYLVHVHEIGKHIQLKERTNMASMELIAAKAGVSRGTGIGRCLL